MEKQWWKERAVYQIYPRSFQDSNGDGIGDIPGIISRLDEIKALGAGIIWLSPVYKSPNADNGYDISDYRGINPEFGTMEDMERLFAEAKRRDIKVIMDLVLNHTSDEHEWFRKSRDKHSPYRDYYIWRPGKKNGKPPNNWTGFILENSWEKDERSGEYYLHLFHKKQPDLNYHNPKVIEEVEAIMRFWLEKGAAGFRCDVINILYKTSLADGRRSIVARGLEHYRSQEGTHAVLRQLRRDVLSHYDCFTVGETLLASLRESKKLSDASRGELDMVFFFEHLEMDRIAGRYIPRRFSERRMLRVLAKWQRGLEWGAVCLENHDQPRIVSHYGDEGEYWARSAKMLATLQLTLRGTPFVYQGQEIGMTNFDYTGLSQLNDTESRNVDGLMRRFGIPSRLRWRWVRMGSRDNARTPMQWTGEPGAGFTTGTPWLGINANHTRINYGSQQTDTDSVLAYYKRMIALRAGSETLKYGDFTPLYAKRGVIAYARALGEERCVSILNFTKKPRRVALAGEVIASNTGRDAYDEQLQPYEAVVLRQTARASE